MVCLFPDLESALAFDDEVAKRRILIPNRPDIFGEQLVMNGEDEVIDKEPHLLSNATTISVEEAPALAARFDGVCYPAHIDREANGMVAVLGGLPPQGYPTVELHDGGREAEYRSAHDLTHSRVVVGSDAHYLWDIRDKEHWLELEDEPYSGALVRQRLIDLLRRGL